MTTRSERKINYEKRRTNTRLEKVQPILEAAREACKRLGGLAMIDDRFTVVDTKYYNITLKEKKNEREDETTIKMAA